MELDGGIHDAQQERDAARTAQLQARGLRVIRFRNEEVLDDLPSVLRRIARAAARPVSAENHSDVFRASAARTIAR